MNRIIHAAVRRDVDRTERALHGLADFLTDAVSVRLQAAPRDFAAVLEQHADRRVVLVVRDAARHAWQEATIASLRRSTRVYWSWTRKPSPTRSTINWRSSG